MCAKRPLDSVTLLAAIEVESKRIDGDQAFNKSDLTNLTLESVCRDLIVRNPQTDTWGFPHASVAEYFVLKSESCTENAKPEIVISLIHFLIDCCAAYGSLWPPPEVKEEQERDPEYANAMRIWFKSADVSLDEPLDPRHPLQTYTQKEWRNHLEDVSDHDPKFEDVGQVLKLFLSDGGPHESSPEYRVFCRYIIHRQPDPFSWAWYCVEPSVNPTFGIVALGLCRLLPGWWDHNLDASELNANGWDLLANIHLRRPYSERIRYEQKCQQL
jgi:hypothetical protein